MLVKNSNFNHLKVHTQYSICEGAIKIDELADYCKLKKIKYLDKSEYVLRPDFINSLRLFN